MVRHSDLGCHVRACGHVTSRDAVSILRNLQIWHIVSGMDSQTLPRSLPINIKRPGTNFDLQQWMRVVRAAENW